MRYPVCYPLYVEIVCFSVSAVKSAFLSNFLVSPRPKLEAQLYNLKLQQFWLVQKILESPFVIDELSRNNLPETYSLERLSWIAPLISLPLSINPMTRLHFHSKDPLFKTHAIATQTNVYTIVREISIFLLGSKQILLADTCRL